MDIVMSVVTIVLLGFVTRRFVGVPVGWPRTIVVSLGVVGIVGVVSEALGRELGWLDAQGFLVGDADLLAVALVNVLVMAWSVAVGIGILVVLEAMVPTGSLPRPPSVLRDLPARYVLGDRLEPRAVRAGLEEQLMRVLPVLVRLPRRIDALVDAAQHGELSMRVRVLADAEDRAFLTGIVGQLVMTLLAGAASICAILLVLADGGPMLSDGVRLLPVLGVTLFLFAFVLAARALVLAFRHTGERHWGARGPR